MKAELQQEHRWLERMLGEWTFEAEMQGGADEPPSRHAGQERVRSLGGAWVVCEGEGEMPDGDGVGRSIMTLGYDPARGRYVGTFVGSMMTHLWLYDGTMDADGRVLSLDTEGPTFTEAGGMARYRDVIEFVSDGHRVLRSSMLGDDGRWREFMVSHYRRRAT